MSPATQASRNFFIRRSPCSGERSKRGHRAATEVLARREICRQLASLLPTIPAISAYS